MMRPWVDEFRTRMQDFQCNHPGARLSETYSIKFRIVSGCFHRSCSPRAFEHIDAALGHYLSHDSNLSMVEHETGPELLVFLLYTTAVVSLGKGLIDLIGAIAKARAQGIKEGDRPDEPVELIIRKIENEKEVTAETILRFHYQDSLDLAQLASSLNQAMGRLHGGGPVPSLATTTPQAAVTMVPPSSNAHLIKAFMQRQLQPNWCWTANATSIGLLLRTGTWTQCATASGVLGQNLNCCVTPCPPACNVYGYLNQALNFTQTLAQMVGGKITARDLEAQITHDLPVCIRFEWNGGGAHFLAITGFSYEGNDPSTMMIFLQDPLHGSSSILLSDLECYYHGGGTWTHTYFTK